MLERVKDWVDEMIIISGCIVTDEGRIQVEKTLTGGRFDSSLPIYEIDLSANWSVTNRHEWSSYSRAGDMSWILRTLRI